MRSPKKSRPSNPKNMSDSTTNRPIPLVARGDLQSETLFFRGIRYRAVKEPLGLNYYHLQPAQYLVLDRLDGRRSLDEIRDEVQRAFPTTSVLRADIQALVTDLHDKGLVYSTRPGQAVAVLRKRQDSNKKRVLKVIMSPFFIRLPGWAPDRCLTLLNRYVGWTFSRYAVVVCVLFVLASWLQMAIRFGELREGLPEFQQFFGWPNLLYMWLTLGFAKALHEIGHGLACKRHGSECHSIGVALLVFSPTLYCDATDSWLLRDKQKRIQIAAAGMYVEVLLAAFAIFLWSFTHPGLLNHLCLNLFFISTLTTVIFNANPLIRFDGYYILSDWLEIPNLREKATMLLRKAIGWSLGMEIPDHPLMPQSGWAWFVIYAIASSLYRCFILTGIFVGLHTVLKPYKLQSVGLAWGAVSATLLFAGMVVSVVQTIKSRKQVPIVKSRLVTVGVVVAVLMLLALFAPLPLHRRTPFFVEPVGVQHVYATVPGTLRASHAIPGARVTRGKLLFELADPKLDDELRQIQMANATAEVDATSLNALGEHEAYVVKLEELSRLKRTLQEVQLQMAQLQVRAAISGTVIAPGHVTEPPSETRREQLAGWNGMPSDAHNMDCFLERRTHLCSLAPQPGLAAILLIDQHDRQDIHVGQMVELKPESCPGITLRGEITEISPYHSAYAPRNLSNKLGGQLPTVTEADGRERLISSAYQVSARINKEPGTLRTGMRGTARFLVSDRSAAAWLWRYLRTTFHFRL